MIPCLRVVALIAITLAAVGCSETNLARPLSGANLAAARVLAQGVPQSTFRVDQFAIRAAVNGVPAPEGTGLPNVKHVVIDPLGVVPLAVHLEVQGVNNEAWRTLGLDGQRAYAGAVLAAVADVFPLLPSDYRWRQARVVVKVWERARELITLEAIDRDEDDPYCFYKVRVGTAYWDCYQPSVAVATEAPRED